MIGVIVTAIVSGIIGFSVAKYRENEMQTEALKCILRYNILRMAERCILNGYITKEELETLHSMNNAYHTLGGNSFVKNLMKKIEYLDIVESK